MRRNQKLAMILLFLGLFINHAYPMPNHMKRSAEQAFPLSIKVLDERPYKYGRLLNVECLAESEDIYEMKWVRENALSRALYYQSYNKILMEIRGMIPMDFGTYTCIAKRKDGVESRNSVTFKRNKDQGNGFDFHIHHEFSPFSPVILPVIVKEVSREESNEDRPSEFHQKENDVGTESHDSGESLVIGNINNDRTIRILEEFQTYTHEGETIKFTCEVDGNINNDIKWEKNMARLPYNHEINQNVLILKNVRPDDTGYYICTYGQKSASVFLGIANKDDPITIVRIQSDKKLVKRTEGDRLEIKCSVVGDLPTKVWWTKHQDENLPHNHRLENNKLILENIKMENFGYYECFGKNALGTFSDFIYLDIDERILGVNDHQIDNKEKEDYMDEDEDEYDDSYQDKEDDKAESEEQLSQEEEEIDYFNDDDENDRKFDPPVLEIDHKELSFVETTNVYDQNEDTTIEPVDENSTISFHENLDHTELENETTALGNSQIVTDMNDYSDYVGNDKDERNQL